MKPVTVVMTGFNTFKVLQAERKIGEGRLDPNGATGIFTYRNQIGWQFRRSGTTPESIAADLTDNRQDFYIRK